MEAFLLFSPRGKHLTEINIIPAERAHSNVVLQC